MTSSMGPPPPKNPSAASISMAEPEPLPESVTAPMGPPNPPQPDSNPEPEPKPSEASSSTEAASTKENCTTTVAEEKQEKPSSATVPYTIPPWSGVPYHRFSLEVLKDGVIIDQFNVNMKGAYMFGRVDLCDFILEHPTISRFHAVLQFKSNGSAYLYDLGSTHGTYINKNQVNKRVYVELHVGDVVRFGLSSRLYVFQGPSDLMPPEADLERIRNAKVQREMLDMQESLYRAKREASLSDGISWGMGEDAIEEIEDEVDEITWQTYKGQLTEKQEKTREKVIKRLEKITHMKKEIDAIRAKDIAQGGLTQGQQTQIARNEQRIAQLLEELENLEETLNESIRESLGARAGKASRGKKNGPGEEDEAYVSSDDDEFYDRTLKPSKRKSGESQSVETADSLLDKRDSIIREIEEKKSLLLDDQDNTVQGNEVPEAGDALDAYMSSLSSQLVIDKKEQISKELSALQSELDRILYLLKIADPTGEALKKRDSKAETKSDTLKRHASGLKEQPKPEPNRGSEAENLVSGSGQEQQPENMNSNSSEEPENRDNAGNPTDDKTPFYTIAKPQWLGAVEDQKKQEIIHATPVESEENDQFVDYKDRKQILEKVDNNQVMEDQGLENAAPGLIIRKRKQVDKTNVSEDPGHSASAEMKAEDAVALLLKHSRGYHASDEEVKLESEGVINGKQVKNEAKKSKRVLGPEKPSFLDSVSDTWVPPEGQSGDGRTTLNDRYGY